MNYNVGWREMASASLIAALLRATDKPALWAVAREIDARLGTAAEEEGESRDPGWRIAFFRPFSVLYYIEDDNRTVVIERLRWVGY